MPAGAQQSPHGPVIQTKARRIHVDFLVVGSGIAGLWYATQAARYGTVAVVTKKARAESNTNYAQGGIASVTSASDSICSHVEDTIEAGAGLCDREVVELVVKEGPARVRNLMDLGANFTRRGGELHLGREGGHSAARIVHARDTTGREVERALLSAIADHPSITVYDYHFAVDLITEHHLGHVVTRLRPSIHCFGAYVYDEAEDRVDTFLAKTTMLATGGSGAVYLHTTNPSIATGDGVAMAYRAKARIRNMEFVQFHPTALYPGAVPESQRTDGMFLISEALRGDGATLHNQDGIRFMPSYHDCAELAPRDIVARAIDEQLKQRGEQFVLLDISRKSAHDIRESFPHIYEECRRCGIDITAEAIPVVPSAHYQCGGVQTDTWGRTSISGLLAAGEVASTGLHGANRLASNSLLEALVFSHRAKEAAREMVASSEWNKMVPDWDTSGTQGHKEWVLVSHNRDELRRVMWDYVGIVRSTLRLERALRRTKLLYKEVENFYSRTRVSSSLCEVRNMIAVAYLIIRSAMMRRESRGLHYMVDYPQLSELERRPTVV